LEIALLDELEWVSDVLGKPKTAIIEWAIKNIIRDIKNDSKWKEKEARFERLKGRRQARIKDLKQVSKVGYKQGSGKVT
jgi:hypothetical protein